MGGARRKRAGGARGRPRRRADPREALVATLARHVPADAEEARSLELIRAFVGRHARPFDRSIAEGHLTGSAVVATAAGARVLLVRHRKLQRWLQPGGHAAAHERSGESVALREAREETGLQDLRLHPSAPCPLDVDVHAIPAHGDEPAHAHLDLRYLVLAAEGAATARCQVETDDLRWFSWRDLAALELDRGLVRALAKAKRILNGDGT